MTVQLMHLIGGGAFGQVYKAAWRGSIVAAKVMNIPTTGNMKVVQNVYK